MSHRVKLLIATVIGLGSAGASNAECRKAQVCDDFGMNCRVQQICSSTTDLPSIELDPLTPLPSTRLKPLPSVGLPPLGARQCEYKQVNGQWQNVCQ